MTTKNISLRLKKINTHLDLFYLLYYSKRYLIILWFWRFHNYPLLFGNIPIIPTLKFDKNKLTCVFLQKKYFIYNIITFNYVGFF